MMKKIILFTVLLFLITSVFSQKNVSVKWSPTYKIPSRTTMSGIIGEDKSGFYAVSSGKYVWLERYDNKMKLKFSKELIMPKKGKKSLQFNAIYYLHGQLILLASITNKKIHKNYVFAYPISKQGVVGSKFKKLDEISMLGRRSGTFDFSLSTDSTKLLVYHNTPYKKYNNEKFSYKVFDSKLNLLWEKDIQLPYKDKYFSIKDYILDNEGNVYMQAEISPDKTKGEKKSTQHQAKKFVILSYKYKTDKLSKFEIKLQDKWITSISYDVNEDTKEIVVGGFYSNDKNLRINGIFYLAMNLKDGSVKTTSKKAFDKSFMTEMIGARKAKKGKGLSSFDFDYFLVKKDGGAYLVAEQYYVVVVVHTDSHGNSTTSVTYHYDDIIVVSVDNKGQIAWVRKVPKISSGGSGYYLSYALNFNPQNNHLNIYFNDNPKNIELRKTNANQIKRLASLKKSIVTLIAIDEEGYMKSTPVFSAKELDKIILRPSISMRMNDTDVITLGIKGKNYKFGRFTFK